MELKEDEKIVLDPNFRFKYYYHNIKDIDMNLNDE